MLTSILKQAACGDFCSLSAGSSQLLNLFLLFLGVPPSSYLNVHGPLSLPLWWQMSLWWQRWQRLYCWKSASSTDGQACESLFCGMGACYKFKSGNTPISKALVLTVTNVLPLLPSQANNQMGITRNEAAVRTWAVQSWCFSLVFQELVFQELISEYLLLIFLSPNILLC